MELALGTVQFGLAYGVAGRGQPVPAAEVRRMLELAWARGVRVLDTASAYGDIEPRLAALCESLPFRLISKIAPVPADLDATRAAAWAVDQAELSSQRLGPMLAGLMFHRADDLHGERGQEVWAAVQRWASTRGITLGASCYDPDTALTLHGRLGLALTQLPGNALDQRLTRAMPRALPGLEVHLRSAFLQGLLLMPQQAAVDRVPGAAPALQRWHRWCEQSGVSPLVGALSVAKGFEGVSAIVVGADSPDQFAAICDAWEQAVATEAPDLHEADGQVTDPRGWA